MFENRTVSSFGISIGTGMMLESLFDPIDERYDSSRTIPNKVNVNDYRYHIYNLTTLARNILSSIPSNVNSKNIIMSSEFTEVLVSELYVLKSLYEDTKCELIFFLPDYAKVHKNINNPNKPNSKYLDYSIAYTVISNIVNTELKTLGVNVIYKDYTLYKLERKNALLTSHIGIDLLNHKHFNKLHLMESHTGILKEKDKYYTKFHKLGKVDLSHIPFLEECVTILGDGVVSNITPLFLRRLFYEVSINHNWKFTTNTEKVRTDISKYQELKEYLDNVKKSYKG